LFRHLPADSPSRLRLLVKFVEKDYEKISTLLRIREEFIARLARLDVELQSEPLDPDETVDQRQQRWYLRKVEGGGFVVQLCALLMAWLAAEDKGMRKFIDEKVGLEEIRETIKGTISMNPSNVEQLENVEEVDETDEDARRERDNAQEEKDIMEVLIDALSDSEGVTNGAYES
jgi:beta-catenin-like protein 1